MTEAHLGGAVDVNLGGMDMKVRSIHLIVPTSLPKPLMSSSRKISTIETIQGASLTASYASAASSSTSPACRRTRNEASIMTSSNGCSVAGAEAGDFNVTMYMDHYLPGRIW